MKQYTHNKADISLKIQALEEAIQVLTHPARRLTYDSFGRSEVEYAWAFKFPQFLLGTIISSGMFYIISIVFSLMRSKAELKVSFKA